MIFSTVASNNYFDDNNQSFQRMLSQLRFASKYTPCSELLSLIAKPDLDKIYAYLLYSASNMHLNNPMKDIKALAPGKAFYLDKKISGLPRTLTILRNLDGEFKVILETKSKMANGSKVKKEKDKGTFKSGGPAWRIDGVPCKLFNAVALIHDDYALNEIKSEVAISNQFGSETVNINDLGPVHTKHGNKTKISIYSEHSNDVLNKLIDKKFFSIPEKDKNQMILDLLRAVKCFHDKDHVHQDIKPNNILVFLDNNGFRLKLTDYGLTRKHLEQGEVAVATAWYQSPEIERVSREPNSVYGNYFPQFRKGTPLACEYVDKQLKDLNKDNILEITPPNKANDIWAIGIVAFEIKYGRKPNLNDKNLIQNDPLLRGLLEGDRAKRVTIDQAIAIHQAAIKSIPQKPIVLAYNQPPRALPTLPAVQPILPAVKQNPAACIAHKGIPMELQVVANTLKQKGGHNAFIFNKPCGSWEFEFETKADADTFCLDLYQRIYGVKITNKLNSIKKPFDIPGGKAGVTLTTEQYTQLKDAIINQAPAAIMFAHRPLALR